MTTDVNREGSRASIILRLVAVAAVAVAAAALAERGDRADAAFHFAVIDEAMFGYGGDQDIQYVEIRMLASGQNITKASRLSAWNADGSFFGVILEVPGNVSAGINNGRWIIATPDFAAAAGITPEFTFAPVSLPSTGMICWGAPGVVPPDPPLWDATLPANYVDCVPYGGYAAPNIRFGPATPFGLGDGTNSLTRQSDTDNTSVDFVLTCPAPQVISAAVGFNHDNHIDLPPNRPFDDLTWPNSDTTGDNCGDADDDNDGLADATETGGAPCASASAPTNPLAADTDGDRTLDGAECTYGTNPNDPNSRPAAIVAPDADSDGLRDDLDPNTANADTDGDGFRDGIEFRHYSSNPASTNTDGDACTDGKEIASVDGNNVVNSADLGIVASAFGNSTTPTYLAAFDVDKNGAVGASDLGLVAARFGSCP